jgi:hypothetical protein
VGSIIFGIGMVMGGGRKSEPKICQEGLQAILAALEELKFSSAPHLTAISSTGLTEGPRDIPFLVYPLYRLLLGTPHADKKVMEKLAVDEVGPQGKHRISGYTVIRASLLTDGKSLGMGKIRVGTEDEPKIGYFISRDDVGLWIYEEIINGDATKWSGAKPTLTH